MNESIDFLGDLRLSCDELLLKVLDVPLLVGAVLRVARTPNKELKGNAIVLRVEIALRLQQVNPIKPVVAPALTHLEFTSELAHNLKSRRAMVLHLDAVVILLCHPLR